ncbi:hypothetical protein ACFVHB_37800 [Kitasatospora sp. NPDC127111]|uniref:hypothetical protein n=1 Tax=Kitasatospora sp. NPDC127111 TaxID=3345363 RepID=UPI0036429810
MSVNIDLHLSVSNLSGRSQAEEVLQALVELLRDEGIEREVGIRCVEDGGEYYVTGEAGYPLIITRFYLWGPKFEEAVARAVGGIAPDAKAVVTWGYPDDED